MGALFHKILVNITGCFRWPNLAGQALAAALTLAIVSSGLDWFYYQQTRSSLLMSLVFPAVILGGLLPILAPLLVLLAGKVRANRRLVNTAWALAQAELLGLGLSFFYKALSGRAHPELSRLTADITRDFHFGLLERGVFWGWPSSHTTVAFAMAITLIVLYPKNKQLRLAALIYAFYIGIGVSLTIHWFSDFLAGAIFGAVVGGTVGKSFYKNIQSSERSHSSTDRTSASGAEDRGSIPLESAN